MKIALVIDVIYPYTIGGSEIRNHEIAKRLAKKGHDVHIYGAKLWRGKDIIKRDGYTIHGIHPINKIYSSNGKRKPLEYITLSIKMFFALLKKDYDIIDVVSFNFFNCYSVKAVSIIKKTQLIFTWQQYFGDYLIGYFGLLKGSITMILERVSVMLSKNNIAVSNHVKSCLLKNGVKEKNIEVIFNGADIALAKSIKKKREIYDLIFVGRLNYQKNIPLLINSVALLKKDLKKDLSNIRVCIVGDGEEKNNLLKLVNSQGLSNNFKFVGRIEDTKTIFEYLKSSKVFVLPSILEGFPLTIIEANACGIPIITTKTKHNNVKEYVIDGKNGILALPNKKEFSHAIKTLLSDNIKRKSMSAYCESAAEKYDWDRLAEIQENYYIKILSR